jgi:hypothetical protein
MANNFSSLPAHYETAFDDAWRMIMAQQTDHRLAGQYQQKMVRGNRERFSQIGDQNFKPRQKTARNEKTVWSDIPTANRWVSLRPFDKSTPIDEDDHILLGSLPDPQGEVVKVHAQAMQRFKDEILINALVGTAYTGQQGTTATTLPSTQDIVVNYITGGTGSNSGLTLAKLVQSSFILDSNDVNEEGRVFIYAAKQLNNLLTSVTEVNSVLYNDVRALVQGRITEFMGYKFIRTQYAPLSGNVRQCVAYHKDFLLLAIGEDMKTKIDILPEYSHTVQVRSKMLMDATRMEEKGVVTISCDESV